MTERMVKAVDEDDTEKSRPVINYAKLGKPNVYQEQGGADEFAEKAENIKTLNGLTPTTKRRISRDIQKFHRGSGGAESKKIEDHEVTGYNAFDVVQPPYNLDYLAKLYEVSPQHYAAVNAKASNIVGLGFTLVETTEAKRKMEDLTGEKLNKFRKKLARLKEQLLEQIDALNEEETFSEVLLKVWKDYEATGNGYIEIGRKINGQIGYIGHVPCTTIRVRKKRDGFVQIISNRAQFFRNLGGKEPDPIGGETQINEIVHIKKYAPSSSFYGVPDIVAAKQAVAGNEFAARFNLDYFENKAVPRHVIILKGATLGTTAEQNILEFFETGLKGKNHRSLFIPLPGDSADEKVDFKIEAVEAGVQDSSFNNYKKNNMQEILMAHRVPLTKVGMAEGVNLAVARDADKTFKEQVCQPEQKILEKKLNRICKEFTDAFQFKLNEMTLTDADTQSKIDERRIKNQIQVPNEIRARDGLPGLPGGDKPVELKPQQKAEARAKGNRQRDSERSANASDTDGEARQPKGEGRATA